MHKKNPALIWRESMYIIGDLYLHYFINDRRNMLCCEVIGFVYRLLLDARKGKYEILFRVLRAWESRSTV